MNRVTGWDWVRSYALTSCLWWLTACGHGDTAVMMAQAIVRDSAGITIIENEDSPWKEQSRWTVSDTPNLVIGSRAGDPRYEFVKVAAATQLSDGRIIVGDHGAKMLRVYDAQGQWLQDVGRAGDGPGEFRSIQLLKRFNGDSLLVFDWSGGRYTVWSPELTHVRTVRVETSSPNITLPHIKAVTGDGVPVLVGARPPWVEDPVGFYGQPGHVLIPDTSGRFNQSIGTMTGQGNLWGTVYNTLGSNVLVVSTGHFEVREYGLDGRLLRMVRRNHNPIEIPPAYFEPRTGTTLLPSGGEGGGIRIQAQAPERDAYPPALPAVDQLLVDPLDNLWLRHGMWPTPETHRYSVFDRQGQLLGSVHIPGQVDVLEVGDQWVIGRTLDDLDVEYVVAYQINKPTR